MASERYYRIWEPRVGRDAADLLRRRAKLVAFPIVALVVIVLMSITLKGSLYYIVTLPLVCILLLVFVVSVARLNRALAVSLRNFLRLEVTTKTLPSFRSAAGFDSWLRNAREEKPPRERSLFGGFIRVRLPPK